MTRGYAILLVAAALDKPKANAMKSTCLRSAVCLAGGVISLSVPSLGHAATLDDPLHGYFFVDGVFQSPDNGTVTPLTTNPPTNFGFYVSPAAQTGTLILDILTPDTSSPLGSIGITGTITGTATLFSSTPWSSGDLAAYLGIPSASPPNKFNPWSSYSNPPGYFIDQANLGTEPLQKDSLSTMSLTLSSALPIDSIIVAFLEQPDGTIGTANSGALFEGIKPTPLPGALALFGTALAGAAGLLARFRRRSGRDLAVA